MTNVETYCVYIIFTETGIPHYVGCSKNETRLNGHEKYPNGKRTPAIILARNLTKQNALDVEAVFIQALGIKPDGLLVNKSTYSNNGWERTPEYKVNLSLCQMGRQHSTETRAKIGAKHKNKIVTEETKEKQRKAKLGRPRSEEAKEKVRQGMLLSWIIRKGKQ